MPTVPPFAEELVAMRMPGLWFASLTALAVLSPICAVSLLSQGATTYGAIVSMPFDSSL